MKNKLLALSIAVSTFNLIAQTTLIGTGASWKFKDNGSNQDTAWRYPGFNDAGWGSGNAQLGYGDGDEATTVSYGPSSSNKYVTTYFRKTFSVNNPSQYTQLSLDILRDDGAVVYLNGKEVFRTNMPQSGAISYNTFASSTVNFGEEDDYFNTAVSASLLVNGTNTIAVEVHQSDGSSSDISFDLKLDAITDPFSATLVRGPYLQTLTQTSVIIKWRTDNATDGVVKYNTTPLNKNNIVNDFAVSTDHEVKITGLIPNTKYYYSIGNSTGDTKSTLNLYFQTAPLEGTKQPYRFWVIGDAGTGSASQRKVRDAYYQYNLGAHADGWIMLGDNAYETGKDEEYQVGVFSNMYEPTLENTALWPALGNHDYGNNPLNISKTVPYFDMFNLPTNGEAGGVPSGSESYYSYNYGNVHFVVLDSWGESRDSTGTMAQWIKQDLAANTQDWTIAYWHHPPYTKGSHNSDNPFIYDYELPQIRQQLIPLLEQYGVDLVLCGHSHCYERSFLIDQHYGNSSSLNSSMILDAGNGSYPTSCAYQKNTNFTKSHKGTIYSVVGCSGKSSGTSPGWPHPIMSKSTNTVMGSLSLEINDNRLDGKFITLNGTIDDAFTIMKNTGKKESYTICEGDSIQLTASWKGAYQWSNTITTSQAIWTKPIATTDVYATDGATCLKDTFNIIVTPAGTGGCPIATGIPHVKQNIIDATIFPNPFADIATLKFNLREDQTLSVIIYDAIGRTNYVLVTERMFNKGTHKYTINTQELDLASGMYSVNIITTTGVVSRKMVVK